VVRVANAMLAVVLAPECAGCASLLEHPLDGPVCAACWAGIRRLNPPHCQVCGGSLPSWRVLDPPRALCASCRQRPYTAIDAGRAAGEYDGALRGIIHAFKYGGRRSLASPLGVLMREAAGGILDEAACAVPVPLHPWRRLQRGFNQAADLAAALGIPVVHALWRQRLTPPQAGLTAGARRRNVRGAFRLSPLVSRRVVHSMLAGRAVVLVDDVRTTGATLDACAHVLKDAGAKEVRVLTAALAEPFVSRRVRL
jgi:ComF family protein